MSETLEEWDRTTGAQLRRIEVVSQLVQHYSQTILEAAERLKYHPAWTSRAMTDLETAILVIGAAQVALVMAKSNIDRKTEKNDGDGVQADREAGPGGQATDPARPAGGVQS